MRAMFKSSCQLAIVLTVCLVACSVDDIVGVDDPAGEVRELHPDYIKSKAGGIALYHSSLSSLRKGLKYAAEVSAFMTDEIQPIDAWSGPAVSLSVVSMDRRAVNVDEFGIPHFRPTGSNDLYGILHSARIDAAQSRTLLKTHGDSLTTPYLANAYALEGFAIVLLAELFCSGIPLTSVPFEGSVQYTPGYSTDSLFAIASSLFDSALSYNHDSTSFYTLARVGKGRAMIGLAEFQSALDAVASVEASDSSFRIFYTGLYTPGTERQENVWWITGADSENLFVENGEGGVGMIWIADNITDQDPRVPIGYRLSPPFLISQKKFDGSEVAVVIADWIHAQMIRSEASLNLHGSSNAEWLRYLNDARRTIGLTDTTDPGDRNARIDLIFRERAFWFWLTGTRQGDMRRLMSQYGRSPFSVYPNGIYEKTMNSGFYGDAFVISPPSAERSNYKYRGCDDYLGQ